MFGVVLEPSLAVFCLSFGNQVKGIIFKFIETRKVENYLSRCGFIFLMLNAFKEECIILAIQSFQGSKFSRQK